MNKICYHSAGDKYSPAAEGNLICITCTSPHTPDGGDLKMLPWSGDTLIFLQLAAVITLFPCTALAQASGTVTIAQLPAYYTVPSPARSCLWAPGRTDLAVTIKCGSPIYNACYCPTATAASLSVSSALSGCLVYWYARPGSLLIPTAVSLYSEYCEAAMGSNTASRSQL